MWFVVIVANRDYSRPANKGAITLRRVSSKRKFFFSNAE